MPNLLLKQGSKVRTSTVTKTPHATLILRMQATLSTRKSVRTDSRTSAVVVVVQSFAPLHDFMPHEVMNHAHIFTAWQALQESCTATPVVVIVSHNVGNCSCNVAKAPGLSEWLKSGMGSAKAYILRCGHCSSSYFRRIEH